MKASISVNTELEKQIARNPAAVAARDVVELIQASGNDALFVGGGVRDLLLDRHPKDFDIATSARPDILAKLFPKSSMVGAKFGVFLVRHSGFSIEVATFREEGEYHDRRRPELVHFSDLENDARRRDFTCNALYYDPLEGHLHDPTGGMNDIKNLVLRAVGDPEKRFNEDALRVVRGLRFAANLEFQVEAKTWSALSAAVPHLSEISMERVRDEMVKGFTGGHPARFLDLLDESAILELLLPEIVAMKGCEQPPEFHPEGDVYIHTRLLLQNLKPDPSPELAMTVLLHDSGKPSTQTFEDRIRFNEHDKVGAEMADQILRRLKFSNIQTDRVSDMVRRHMKFMNVPRMRASTLNKFLAAPTIEDELELHRVDCLASHGNLDTYNFAVQKLKEFREDEIYKGQLPQPLISGHDLIELGLKPGPIFSKILSTVFDAQLDGTIRTHEDALAEAHRLANAPA